MSVCDVVQSKRGRVDNRQRRHSVHESFAIAKMTALCALYRPMGGCPENFRDPWLRQGLLYAKFL